jgi:hypothetical protein
MAPPSEGGFALRVQKRQRLYDLEIVTGGSAALPP